MTAHQVAALLGSRAATVAELVELGLHRSTIAHRCRPGGPWRSMAPGVVLLHNAPPNRDDRRAAGLRHAGPGAVLTGLDALELHGMHRVPKPGGPVHVLVPESRRRSGHGLILVERTERLPVADPGRWPLAPLPRAVLDFARRSREREHVRAGIAEVVQRGRCTPATLWAELLAGTTRGIDLPKQVLQEVSDGVRSVAEAGARTLIRESGLPQPMWNPRLVHVPTGEYIATPDAWFDDLAVAWEIDSHEFHLSPAAYEQTLRRRVRMTATGILVVAHTPRRVHDHRLAVRGDLADHLAQAALRPRPPIRALPATSGAFVA